MSRCQVPHLTEGHLLDHYILEIVEKLLQKGADKKALVLKNYWKSAEQ
jgi:hypothetical protein